MQLQVAGWCMQPVLSPCLVRVTGLSPFSLMYLPTIHATPVPRFCSVAQAIRSSHPNSTQPLRSPRSGLRERRAFLRSRPRAESKMRACEGILFPYTAKRPERCCDVREPRASTTDRERKWGYIRHPIFPTTHSTARSASPAARTTFAAEPFLMRRCHPAMEAAALSSTGRSIAVMAARKAAPMSAAQFLPGVALASENQRFSSLTFPNRIDPATPGRSGREGCPVP